MSPDQPVHAEEPLELRLEGHVAHLTLNRPAKLNAIDGQMLQLLDDYFAEIEADPDVRSVLVQARGRAFCAGADLEHVTACLATPGAFGAWLDEWHRIFRRVEHCAKPTVAAVQGMALAGGLELTQVFDVVVAADDARFGDQHAKLGLFPGGGSTQRLPRLVGRRHARWMLLTGETISAQEAWQYGLVTRVVPAAEALGVATDLAVQLAQLSMSATAAIKKAALEGADLPLDSALLLERLLAVEHMAGADPQIGLRAFRARETPVFTGYNVETPPS